MDKLYYILFFLVLISSCSRKNNCDVFEYTKINDLSTALETKKKELSILFLKSPQECLDVSSNLKTLVGKSFDFFTNKTLDTLFIKQKNELYIDTISYTYLSNFLAYESIEHIYLA